MLKLYRRSRDKNFSIRGTLHGVHVERSAGTSDREEAERLLAAFEIKIKQEHLGLSLGQRLAPTFAEAALNYIDKGGERRFVRPLYDYFGDRRCDQISQRDIDEAARRLLPGRAPATVNRQIMGPVSAILKAAGVTVKVKRCKEPPPRVRWLEPEEAQRLLSACNSALRPLVAFLLATGARAGEALFLDWSNVDLERAHVNFPKTKNGKARGIPLMPEIVAMLANFPHRQGAVFRRLDGKPYTKPDENDLSDTSAGTRIGKAWGGACRRAGITDFHPHDCRHTWATWHYRANRDLLGLQHDGGWKSLRMVERYAHVNKEHRRSAYENLPRLEINGK